MRFGLDPHPIRRAGTSAILLVALLQWAEIGLVLNFPLAIRATPLLALQFAFHAHVYLLVGSMALAAQLAVIGAICRLGWVRILLFVPQHFVLGVMALGGIAAAFEGHYLDGTRMDWPHIAADQLGITVLWLVHGIAIVKRARDPDG